MASIAHPEKTVATRELMRKSVVTRFHGHFETLIAVLLGLAACLTAVTGYQASLKDGDSIQAFNSGIRSINDANGYYSDALQTANRDQTLFVEYAKALRSEDKTMATYLYGTIMDDNMRKAVDEWLDDDEDKIATPLDAPSYASPDADEGDRLTTLTDRQFAQARSLDNTGDRYGLVGVIVASSLFFLGIAGVLSSTRIKVMGTVLGAVTLIVSFVLWLMV